MHMQTGLQTLIAFHLSGVRRGGELTAINGLDLRPALLARYRDLDALRHDFPLALIPGQTDGNAAQPLSALIDAACARAGEQSDAERLRKHGRRIERELRKLAGERSKGQLSALWEEAGSRLGAGKDGLLRDSLTRLRAAIRLCGEETDCEIVGCDKAMPFRLCHHVWKMAYEQKARRFHQETGHLVMKLAEILRADFIHSPEGLSAGNLRASMGGAPGDAIDFEILSQLLTRTSSRSSLTPTRRRRISWLLSTLESQRFYPPLTASEEHLQPFGFVFESCADAIAAYRDRLPRMVELAKAIAMAGLEIEGEYVEQKHDTFFVSYGADGLDPGDFDLFPDYLILMHASEMGSADAELILGAFSAGMRAKVLVQTDDLLEPSPITGGVALALRARQLVNAAIGLGGFYVLQSPSSNLLKIKDQIVRGFFCSEPALFSIYSGATDNGLPPYLNAAAALESRAFPAFTYDPPAGPDWAGRFDLSANPQPDRDWPVHDFDYEDEDHQKVTDRLAFTLVDFMACDPRCSRHFAKVPREKCDDKLAPVSGFLAPGQNELSNSGLSGKAPRLLMTGPDAMLHKVVVDDKLVREARRGAEAWRRLQKLSGRRSPPAAPRREEARQTPVEAPAEAERPADDPHIETARCSSCNECVRINGDMFAYDSNQQAFIKNPDAGTYRQLVEAAENCQLSIIHPGQPRNQQEPGLAELLKRAEPFM
jgi:ferredoxin